MNKKIVFFTLILLLNCLPVYGYFEYKYYCKIDSDKINVSLKQEEGYTKCLDIIKSLNSELKLVKDNIYKSETFIEKKEDIEFWLGINEEMLLKQKNLKFLLSQIIETLDKFELQLFNKLKKILDYQLNKTYNKLEGYYNFYKNNSNFKIKDGDEKEYRNYLNKMDKVFFEMLLIDTIRNAEDFETMIPVLRYWFNNYYLNSN